jgi:hypothetical protein
VILVVAGDEDVERLAVDLPGANLNEQARQHERARGLSVSRFAHPRLLMGRFRLQVNPQRGLCLAGCGLVADVRVTDESGGTMSNFRRTIQTVRKR